MSATLLAAIVVLALLVLMTASAKTAAAQNPADEKDVLVQLDALVTQAEGLADRIEAYENEDNEQIAPTVKLFDEIAAFVRDAQPKFEEIMDEIPGEDSASWREERRKVATLVGTYIYLGIISYDLVLENLELPHDDDRYVAARNVVQSFDLADAEFATAWIVSLLENDEAVGKAATAFLGNFEKAATDDIATLIGKFKAKRQDGTANRVAASIVEKFVAAVHFDAAAVTAALRKEKPLPKGAKPKLTEALLVEFLRREWPEKARSRSWLRFRIRQYFPDFEASEQEFARLLVGIAEKHPDLTNVSIYFLRREFRGVDWMAHRAALKRIFINQTPLSNRLYGSINRGPITTGPQNIATIWGKSTLEDTVPSIGEFRRGAVVALLFRTDQKFSDIVSELLEGIEKSLRDPIATIEILIKLGRLGNHAQPASMRIVELMDHKDDRVVIAAGRALNRIEVENKALSHLRDHLKSEREVQFNAALIGISRMGEDASAAVGDIDRAIKHRLSKERIEEKTIRLALEAFYKIGPDAKGASETLVALVLSNKVSDDLARQAVYVFDRLGRQPDNLTDQIVRALYGKVTPDRAAALVVLISFIAERENKKILALLHEFAKRGQESGNKTLRGAVLEAMGYYGVADQESFKFVGEELVSEQPSDFGSALFITDQLTEKFGRKAKSLEPYLVQYVSTIGRSDGAKTTAIKILARIRADAAEVRKLYLDVFEPRKLFEPDTEKSEIRTLALNQLARIGWPAHIEIDKIWDARIAFFEQMGDSDADLAYEPSTEIAESALLFARAVQGPPGITDVSNTILKRQIASLEDIKEDLEAYHAFLENADYGGPVLEDITSGINQTIGVLKERIERNDNRLYKDLIKLAEEHFEWLVGVGIYVALVLTWLVLFLVWPASLMSVDRFFRPLGQNQAVRRVAGFSIPVTWAIFLRPFADRDRVLDAWIGSRIPQGDEPDDIPFFKEDTVSLRRNHVPLPAKFGGLGILTGVKELRDLLAPYLTKDRLRLAILGPGGIGKTSIACLIGRIAFASNSSERFTQHRILPVLIEMEVTEGLRQPIVTNLDNLLGEMLPDWLMRRMLKRRRVLVIVDRFSELSETSQDKIRADITELEINALVVTARTDNRLRDCVLASALEPLGLRENRQKRFLIHYFEGLAIHRGMRNGKDTVVHAGDCLSDAILDKSVDQLSELSAQTELSVLLVKLFADDLVRSIPRDEENWPLELTKEPDFARSVPDLMERYINSVLATRDAPEVRIQGMDFMKSVAWACIERNCGPGNFVKDDVRTSLEIENFDELLGFFVDAGILREDEMDDQYVGFQLDPVAEALAAIYQTEQCRDDGEAWRKFCYDWWLRRVEFEEKNKSEADDAGFLRSLRRVMAGRGEGMGVPNGARAEVFRLMAGTVKQAA